MFCYQRKSSHEVIPCTKEEFARLIISDEVVNRIKQIRRMRSEGKDKGADLMKRGLPLLCFNCSDFDPTPARDNSRDGHRKKGQMGRWRVQKAVRLNGMYMVDYDHIKASPPTPPPLDFRSLATIGTQEVGRGEAKHEVTPRELFDSWVDAYVAENEEARGLARQLQIAAFCNSLGIVLAHETSSGDGLRLVGIADAARGNLADNQAWLTAQLSGVTLDKSIKDASRGSFCPSFDDILFINNEKLFDYDNKDYDETFGPLYRGGNSKPIAVHGNGSDEPAGTAGKTPDAAVHADAGGQQGTAAADNGLAGRIEEGYHGKPYEIIIRQWFTTVQGGMPQAGDRHASLYRLACDLRYITDFDPQLLARVLELSEVGQAIARERGTDEIERLAADACALQRWRSIPQRLQKVLAAVGIQLDGQGADAQARTAPEIDYGYWWSRLAPLLSDSPGYREAVATLPDEHKMAGVLAAGAMFGTYLTRCWWEHFDGNDYRLSFLVYIIGSAASGKSFVQQMDSLIMAPMIASDRVGREWERQYKEEMKKRAASSKNAKQEAPEQQHPVIRYVPSTISNAMLYRRLTDALDNSATGPDGQPMHLHCYTCEAELATALRAQTGSWAGKLDLECKSFQNEVAGVDYANDQSTNGIIQVNWNQVVTGTPDALARKIRPSTVLDGLVTRLVLFPMPQNDFAMIERRRALRDHERESLLRSIGIRLEEVKGELKCERLVDFCYQYELELAREAKLEDDHCLDYFRKRIPLIMMRYTLVRMVLRTILSPLTSHLSPLEVSDSDLEFARLIGDFCLMAQMHFFGQQVMDAQEREQMSFTPRKRSRKVREAYAALPEELTTETLVVNGVAKDLKVAGIVLSRWLEDGLLERLPDSKKYKKVFKEIPM